MKFTDASNFRLPKTTKHICEKLSPTSQTHRLSWTYDEGFNVYNSKIPGQQRCTEFKARTQAKSTLELLF